MALAMMTPRRSGTPVRAVPEMLTPRRAGGPVRMAPEMLTTRRAGTPMAMGVVPEIITRPRARSEPEILTPRARTSHKSVKWRLLHVDVPQLRQWFNHMDRDRSGHVTKEE